MSGWLIDNGCEVIPGGKSGFIKTGDSGPGTEESLNLWHMLLKECREGPMTGCSVRSFRIRIGQIHSS